MRYATANKLSAGPKQHAVVALAALVGAVTLTACLAAEANDDAADARPTTAPAATTRPAGLRELADQQPEAAGEGDLDSSRAALERLVEVRKLISRERQEFELAREVLTGRTELVQREIGSLQEKIEQVDSDIAEANAKFETLEAENQQLKETAAALGETVARFEMRTRALLERLPQPIRESEQIETLSQKLPDDAEATKLSLGKRFQNVIGILTKVNEFHHRITVSAEVRELPDGRRMHVTALYLGISQGYYVGAEATVAGIGTASGDGWVWTPANEAAPRIAEAIAILRNEQPAAFIQLPVELDEAPGDDS